MPLSSPRPGTDRELDPILGHHQHPPRLLDQHHPCRRVVTNPRSQLRLHLRLRGANITGILAGGVSWVAFSEFGLLWTMDVQQSAISISGRADAVIVESEDNTGGFADLI